MVSSDSSGSLPWSELPRREFPAQRWVVWRFGFRLPPLHLRQCLPTQQREFPVKQWLKQRQARSG